MKKKLYKHFVNKNLWKRWLFGIIFELCSHHSKLKKFEFEWWKSGTSFWCFQIMKFEFQWQKCYYGALVGFCCHVKSYYHWALFTYLEQFIGSHMTTPLRLLFFFFYLSLIIYHNNNYEKNGQIFCVYKL